MSDLLKERTGGSGGLGRGKKACVGKAKGAKGVRFKNKVGEARVAGARSWFWHLGSRADIGSVTPVKTTQ